MIRLFVDEDLSQRERFTLTEAAIIATEEPAGEAAFELVLYPALLKGKRFDLAIQKCVELGCARIVPVITQRTISRPDAGKLSTRVTRWRKIAEEACRQCGRARIPQIAEPLPWESALEDWKASEVAGIIPYEALAGDRETELRAVLAGLKQTARLGAFIGPEGGYSPTEIRQALEAGLTAVSLGPRILRAETAAISLCAIVMYEMESQR